MKIPRSVTLDGNIKVHVKRVNDKMITAVGGTGFGGRSLCGLWDDTVKTIYINKNLSESEQWSTFRHELIHAIIDVDHEAFYNATKASLAPALQELQVIQKESDPQRVLSELDTERNRAQLVPACPLPPESR